MASFSDDFNRANEAPLGAPYTQHAVDSGTTELDLDSNAVSRGLVGTGEPTVIHSGTWGPDVEVSALIDDGSTFNPFLLLTRLVNPGDSATGYIADITRAANADIYRMDSGYDTKTVIASAAAPNIQVLTWRLRCLSSTITLSYSSGGAFTDLIITNDATYATAGRVGFGSLVFFSADNFLINDLSASAPRVPISRVVGSGVRW